MADSDHPVDRAVSRLAPVTLAEVVEHAASMVRVDRKYLVPRPLLPQLVHAVGDHFRVLQIDGRRSTTYTSRYLDTGDLASCRAHLQGRRRRWKVRVRHYLEDGLTRVEVKTRDGRGTTHKDVLDAGGPDTAGPDGPAGPAALDAGAARFVASVLDRHGFDVDVAGLRPTMEVRYRRTTLADTAAGMRLTLDHGMVCELDGRQVRLDEDYVVLETKGGLRPGPADRALLAGGVRPRSLSKYASAASLLREDLADNDVRRLLGVVLHTRPRDLAAPAARAS